MNDCKNVDTIRLMLTMECNLRCSYCCNHLDSVRQKISPVRLQDIVFENYMNVCLTGGEPFLNNGVILYDVLNYLKYDETLSIYIYTNGILMKDHDRRRIAMEFPMVKGINIGLHEPKTFNELILRHRFDPIVRFQVEDKYLESLQELFPTANIKSWVRDECDMKNEHLHILTT